MQKLILLITVVFLGRVAGLPDYTGFSGAPGTQGSCAIHCHGTTGGSITVAGFPSAYQLGDTYLVRVAHHGGLAISNFNASIRIDTTAGIAGVLLPGLNTEVYAVPISESVGAHFTTPDQDSGNFRWVAPGQGTGEVRFYLSGLQGTVMDGPNTQVRLVAAELPSGVAENAPASIPRGPALRLENRVVADYLVLTVGVPTDRIVILNSLGRRAGIVPIPTGSFPVSVIWEPMDSQGRRLLPGSYFALLRTPDFRETRKFVIAR